MVLGKSVAEILELFGHNGLQVLWPDLKEPNRYRGFSEFDLIEVCYAEGYAALPIPMCPVFHPPGHPDRAVTVFNEEQTLERVNKYMDGNIGIISGWLSADIKHACAWDGFSVFDPQEPRIYTFDDPPEVHKIMIETFYLIDPLAEGR